MLGLLDVPVGFFMEAGFGGLRGRCCWTSHLRYVKKVKDRPVWIRRGLLVSKCWLKGSEFESWKKRQVIAGGVYVSDGSILKRYIYQKSQNNTVIREERRFGDSQIVAT
jgi:hypothetical protein